MRIVFPTTEYVTEASYAGGLANYLHRIASALRNLGHEPHIVVISGEAPASFIEDGIRVHRQPRRRAGGLERLLKSGSGHKDVWMSHIVNRSLRRLHALHAFDVIQYPSYRALALKRMPGAAAVARISSHRRLWNQAGVQSGGRLRDTHAERLEQTALRRVDAVYAPSRVLSDAVSADIGRTVSVIEPPFHVDTAGEDETLLSRLGSEPYLLFFGTMSELKGVGTIARALPGILSLDPSLQFVFVGKDAGLSGGPAVNVLRSAAGEGARRVVHMPPVPHQQLYPLVRNARAVVLPSLIDNLPNTCLESMGLGQVVVGTRGASFDQLITDGENGFLCDPGDPSSLHDALSRALVLSQTERARVAAAAQARIAELAPEKAAGRLVAFLEGVLEAR